MFRKMRVRKGKALLLAKREIGFCPAIAVLVCLAATLPTAALFAAPVHALQRSAHYAAGQAPVLPCPPDASCMVGENTTHNGRYILHVPKSWNGRRALPALVFFHGYQSSARQILSNPDIVGFSDKTGILLIVPDGVDGSWSVTNGPRQARDEFGFVHAVLEDVAKSLPLDRHHIVASGFSLGASMVWDLACYHGAEFSAFLPIAGSFWVPLPRHCPSRPMVMRHIHGIQDHTMPLVGRPIAKVYRQGDVLSGFLILARRNMCPLLPSRITHEGALTCQNYGRCASGRALALCFHEGEHVFKAQWLVSGWRWLMRQRLPEAAIASQQTRQPMR